VARADDLPLPSLIIIGAAKCGTTSLHNYLNAHPEISMSEVKEIDFFSNEERWAKGVQWYSQHFDPDAPLRGESSTSYTRGDNAPVVAERISKVAPEVKLIYLVRDPIDRVRSDYFHHRAKGRERRDLAEVIAVQGSPYVEASRYSTQLKPFVDTFGIDRIRVETQEQLLQDRDGSLAQIFDFVGVDPSFKSPAFDRLWEQSEGKGWAYSLALKVRSSGIRLPPVLRWPAQRIQRSRMLGGAKASAKPPELDARTREALTELLQSEVDDLRRLTGRSYDEWSL
jgi:hypothetical protein